MHDLQQLALIWASVFIASWLAAKTKLTPVLYFLAAGCVLVNLGWLPTHSTPFIAMNIAYTQHGIFTEEVFYTLMFTIFWLNIAVPVTIRFWRPYYSGEKPLPAFLGVRD